MIRPDNIPSIRLVEPRCEGGLVERFGFRCEGSPLTDYWCVGNKYLSVMVFA